MVVHAHTTLRSSVLSPARARAFTRDAVAQSLADVDDLTLVVSELVTNAVVHGAGDVSLALTVDGDAVRIEVADEEPTLDRPAPADLDVESGRGLMLVSRVARSWGVRREGHGKTVWADLATRR